MGIDIGVLQLLQPGDLIFQHLDTPISNAIARVTRGYNGYKISHVGMFLDEKSTLGNAPLIIEAFDKYVEKTTLYHFCNRSKTLSDSILIFRVNCDNSIKKKLLALLKNVMDCRIIFLLVIIVKINFTAHS